MKVQTTKEERTERQRLEAILIDETKTESDRDFARERLQAIREDAVARAKVRVERRADYVEAKPVEDEFPLPVKPLREENESPEDFEARLKDYWQDMNTEFEQRLSAYETEKWFIGDIKLCEEMFHSQAEYQEARERWQLCLNENAAQKVLDSSSSTHSARQSAERTIRKVEKRRSELDPDASTQIAYKPATSGLFVDRKNDDRPFAEREPFEGFKKRHPRVLEGREQGTTESQAWEDLCGFMDYLDSQPARFKSEHPRNSEGYRKDLQAWEDQPQVRAEIDADNERRAKNAIDHSGKKSVDSNPFVASPLQKETWNAQSQKFARERGEIVGPKVAPAVESPKRDIAYEIVLDGLLVWQDGSPYRACDGKM